MIWIKPDDVHEEYAKWVWGAAPTK
jgi:hypothetical protein